MNKIYITGGSRGIGLEITKQFSDYDVTNFDISNGYDITSDATIKKIVDMINSQKPKYVFLNAGIGEFTSVENISTQLIQKMFEINVVSNIKIISGIFNSIKNNSSQVIVTLSSASYINGAFESVYNATKKAMKEFIISANTELKDAASDSFIFSFVPHFIAGTGMTGGTGNTDELHNMILNLKASIAKGDKTFIPKYEAIYKKVFDRYVENPIQQGIESIKYKRSKGKL